MFWIFIFFPFGQNSVIKGIVVAPPFGIDFATLHAFKVSPVRSIRYLSFHLNLDSAAVSKIVGARRWREQLVETSLPVVRMQMP